MLILAASLLIAPLPEALPRAAAQQQLTWRDGKNYDFDRPPPGGYFADEFYFYDPKYRDYTMAPTERVYRGRDGRYYCRRADGTTGIVKGPGLEFLGHRIDNGRSSIIGSIMDSTAGTEIGPDRATDARKALTCTK